MNTYLKVNITIAAVLILVLLLLFWGISTSVVECPFQNNLGIPCTSCGVSRDIFRYLRLNFQNPINEHSLKIFTFFVSQVILRCGLWVLKIKDSKSIIRLDILISSIWIIYVFGSLLFL